MPSQKARAKVEGAPTKGKVTTMPAKAFMADEKAAEKAANASAAAVAFLSEAVSSTEKAAARAAEKESPVTKVFVTATTMAT